MNTKQLRRVFKFAKQEALKSEYKHKLGAVIYDGNKIISKGFNSTKTHPKMQEHNEYATIHAETHAVINSRVMVRGMSIFVYRQHKDETLAIAKPCKNCERILTQCGIKDVYYTTDKFPFYDKLRLN